MDTSFQAHKSSITKEIADVFVRAVEEGELEDSELPVASADALYLLHEAQTSQELFENLKQLNAVWPFFDDLLDKIQQEEQEEKTVEQTEKMQQLLKENKVDEALESVNQQSTP